VILVAIVPINLTTVFYNIERYIDRERVTKELGILTLVYIG